MQEQPRDRSEPAGPVSRNSAGDRTPTGVGRRTPTLRLLLPLALLAVLALGAAFRFTHLEWDERLALHPDERFLTFVETSIAFPEPCRPFIPVLRGPGGGEEGNFFGHLRAFFEGTGTYLQGVFTATFREGKLGACLREYLDSASSPLNPRNRGHSLWVYGSLPITFLRAVLDSLHISEFFEVTLAGRVFSAVVDLLTVLLTFFLGKRLYDARTGLLAALFLALSAFNIQNAHFFTVDTTTSLLTLLALYLTVVVAEGRGKWGTFALLGLAFGAAVASKVNMALFALVIALAGAVRVWRRVREQGEEARWPAARDTALGLVLAAILSLTVFRLAQPDAFTGPGFFDVWPEARYLSNLGTVRDLVSGEMDYYPGHQWTNRAPLLFPWQNMVLWGMGLPLGLTAWVGVVWAGWQLVRKRDLRPLVPLTWTLFLFIYQGVQFVKTMRYFLPLYPLLCIFAACFLLSLWERARARESFRPRWRTALAGTLLGVVVLGTGLWAWGFIQIYRRPVTRAVASRWIYKNIPTDRGAFLTLADGGEVPIPIPNAYDYTAGGPPSVTPFALPAGGTAVRVTIAHLQDPTDTPGEEELEVAVCADAEGREVLARGIVVGDFRGPSGDAAPGRVPLSPLALEAGRTYYLRLRALRGIVRTWAVALANEHWDDAIPMRVDGKDGFSIYRGLQLEPYAEDTPEKVENLLRMLSHTDYLCLTSNRLYDSIPRLPMRYPATTRYYQALFDGSLGFERVATFTSYPTLFALGVPEGLEDTSDEERARLLSGWMGLPIPDQGAEEAFSVYDHPKVQIFRRTEAFDIEQARRMLTEGIDWENIARLRPIDVPSYRDLLLTPEEARIQQEGGTWSEIFPSDGWPTRLALPLWLLLVEGLGLLALPLAHFFLGRLADGGYLPAKVLGILLLGYLSWILAATQVLPYTRWTLLLVLGLLLAVSGIVGWRRRRELAELFRTRRRLLLLEEAVFLGGFFLFLLIRMGNPDVWHPYFGGEKPMDLAYLTAIVRSTTFPPYDPWFAGGYLNYYYFGHVLLAGLIKLTGIVPAVAYNLAIPLLYGLTCGGAFTVVYHLVERGNPLERRAVYAGLAGSVFVALLGNLGEYMLILNKLGEAGGLALESTIPGLAAAVKGVAGLFQVLRGAPFNVGLHQWYWDASRVITDVVHRGVHGGEINEFPFFTFLYADLHAHMIALPLTLLALTQIVALSRHPVRDERPLRALFPPVGMMLGMALVLGALRAGNSWDFPTYFLLAVLGWAAVLYGRRRVDLGLLLGPAVLAAVLWLGSPLLFQPFWNRYGAFYTSVDPWTGERTRVGEYLIINGFFLFILVSYLLAETLGRGVREKPLRLLRLAARFWDRLPTLFRRLRRWGHPKGTALSTLLGAGLPLLVLVLFFLLPAPEVAQPSFFQRLRQQHLLGWLVLFAAPALILFFRRRQEAGGRLTALLILGGLGLSGGVELWVLRGDIGRMNTFFKFYLQIWVLFALASAAALPRLWERLQGWARRPRRLWRTAFFLLLGLCALYPLLATPAKIHDRFPNTAQGWGLNGEAFMQTDVYDDGHGPIVLAQEAGAIAWLRAHVEGSPVVLEGFGPIYRSLVGRISIYTGLPTLIGYDWHQKQQRVLVESRLGYSVVDRRVRDVETLYSTTDLRTTLDLLRRYRVSYIVVGEHERHYYPETGLAKFEQMVGTYLERVYPAGEAGQTAEPPAGETPSPYPPPAPSTAYPAPSYVASEVASGGTVIYRVLPAVWEP
ncbi:MAG: DUF2298 domain-containing protein [Chloroflexia bacterium]